MVETFTHKYGRLGDGSEGSKPKYEAFVRHSDYEVLRAELEQVKQTLAVRDHESDFLKRRGDKAVKRAEAAERLAGARREIECDVKSKIRVAFRKALSDLPEIAPNEIASVLSSVPMRDEFFVEGKRLQMKHGVSAVAPRVEQECGAGAWSFMRAGVLSALAEPAGETEPVAQWQRREMYPVNGAKPEWRNCTSKEATGHFERSPQHEYRALYATPPDASAIRGALDIPECVLSLCADKITMAFETSEDATCAFDAIDAALAGAKP